MKGSISELRKRNICDLCGNNNFEVFITIPKLERRIVKCNNCGLVFAHPINSSFLTFDFEDEEQRERKYHQMRVAAEGEGKFDEDMIRREEVIRTLHFRNRKEEIERYVKTGRLLDIGCGRGFFLANFVGSNIDYFGIEPRRRISEEAKKRVGENKIFCGTLNEANLPDSHFDIVTMINLIEHLPSPKETLKEVNRLVKTGGRLLIETPNVESMVPKVLGKRWHAFLEYEHHYFFSKDTLSRMLRDTGFRVDKIRRGSKLFSFRYLLYRLSWYNRKISTGLENILDSSNLLEKTVKIPQVDELIVIAQKVTTLQKDKQKLA